MIPARFLLVLALAALAQMGFTALTGAWRPAPVVGYLAAAMTVAASVLAVGAAAPVMPKRRAPWIAVPVGALVAFGVAEVDVTSLAPLMGVTLALLAAGALTGALLGGHVTHPGHLLVVAYVSTVADLYSVLTPSGPSARVLESDTLLPLLAVSWPVPGLPQPAPLLGVGDVIVTAIYLAASRRHELHPVRSGVALALAYAAVFALVALTARPIPALPFLAAAVLVAHPRARRLTREDRRPAFIGMAAITLLFILLRFG